MSYKISVFDYLYSIITSFLTFPYPKYNDLVMQLGISKNILKRKKGECINYEKAD